MTGSFDPVKAGIGLARAENSELSEVKCLGRESQESGLFDMAGRGTRTRAVELDWAESLPLELLELSEETGDGVEAVDT